MKLVPGMQAWMFLHRGREIKVTILDLYERGGQGQHKMASVIFYANPTKFEVRQDTLHPIERRSGVRDRRSSAEPMVT